MWLQPDDTQSAPHLLTNLSIDSEWEFVPTKVLPACCLPADLPEAACMLKVTGPHENVLQAALRRGCRLTLYQLKAIVVAFSVPVPQEGSGKNKQRIKIDYVRAVIQHFFPTESQEEKERLAKEIMGRKILDTSTDDAPEVQLKLLSKLDPAEAPEFDVMKKAALDLLAEESLRAKTKKNKKNKAEDVPDAEEAEPQQETQAVFEPRVSGAHVKAPPEFKQLLPPGVDYLYFRWEPQSFRCAVDFVSPVAGTEGFVRASGTCHAV